MSKQVLLGFHAVSARLRFSAASIVELYIDAARNDKRMLAFAQQAKALGIKVYPVEAFRLNGLAKGGKHQGVVAIAVPVEKKQHLEDILEDLTEPALLLVLDQITDPHNLGACLRSANAAGVHAVIAPKDHSANINSTVERVASGAATYTPYITVTNLARTLRDLKDRGIWIVGTDDEASTSIYQVDAKLPTAWVLGAEGEGMRRLTRETCDTHAYIPMLGSVESLNVSVAAAVCLYETVRQRTV